MNPDITNEDVYKIKKQEEINEEPYHDAEMRKSHTNDTELSDTTIKPPYTYMVV